MDSNKLENRGNSGLLDIWWGSIFTTASTLHAKDGDKVSKWDLGKTKRGCEDGKVRGGVWTASNVLSTAAGTNEDNYPSNNISLSEGMEGKDKWLCLCVCVGGYVSVCACTWWLYVCVHATAVREPFLLSRLQSLPHSLNLNISLLAHNNCIWASYPPYQIWVCTKVISRGREASTPGGQMPPWHHSGSTQEGKGFFFPSPSSSSSSFLSFSCQKKTHWIEAKKKM